MGLVGRCVWVGLCNGCDGSTEAVLCASCSVVVAACGGEAVVGLCPPWMRWRSAAGRPEELFSGRKVTSELVRGAAWQGWTEDQQ